MKRGKAVIIGAGALGLGFLAERMAPGYDLCLADTSAKSELLSHLQRDQGFTLNVCGRDGIVARKVIGLFETALIDTAEGDVDDLDLVFLSREAFGYVIEPTDAAGLVFDRAVGYVIKRQIDV